MTFGFDQLFLIAGVIVGAGIILLALTYIVPLLGALIPLAIFAIVAFVIYQFLRNGGLI